MLFNSIIYGPIHSRRLGTSLGVELMPLESASSATKKGVGLTVPPSTKELLLR